MEGAAVGGEAGVFGRVDERLQREREGFAVLALRVERQGEEGVELAVVGELEFRRAQNFRGAVVLAERAQRGAEADEGVGEFVRRQAERDGFFVGGQRLLVAAERVAGPRDLVGDLGDVRVARVEVLQAREELVELAVRARADDGVEFLFPGRKFRRFGHRRKR